MRIHLLMCIFIHVIHANISEFRISVDPDSQKSNVWDPQWIRPLGQSEELIFSVGPNCYHGQGHALITLLPDPEAENRDVFAFMFGVYTDTTVGLLKNNVEVYSMIAPDAVNCRLYDMWIRWSSNDSWLALGAGNTPGENTWFLYQSDTPVSAVGHKLSAEGTNNPAFEFVIAANQVNDIKYSCRRQLLNDVYEVYISAENKTSTVFQLLAFNEAYICLSEWPVTDTCIRAYRIQLGAEDSGETVGHDDVFTDHVAIGSHKALSSVPEMTPYWISWGSYFGTQRVVAVGTGRNVGENTFFSFIPKTPRDIKTIAFGSAESQFSEWIITP